MSTAAQIRTWIDNFREFERKRTRFELLISYDCSNKHNPFRAKLLNLLVMQKGAIEINESLYKLPKPMNIEEIINLANEIEDLFSEVINEGKDSTATNVQFILPSGTVFDIYTIINKKA